MISRFKVSRAIVIIIVSISYIIGIWIADTEFNLPAVVLGSLLGAFPLFIFEMWNELKASHATLVNERVVKHPKKWSAFDTEQSGYGVNAICVRATICNDGFEPIENCRVTLCIEDINEEGYMTRWNIEGTYISIGLSPGESREVDLFWIDFENHDFLTPSIGNAHPDETHERGSYQKARRYEVPPGDHQFYTLVSGDNMPEQRFNLSSGKGSQVLYPDYFLDNSEDSNLIETVKRNEIFVIRYGGKEKEKFEVPAGVDYSEIASLLGLREDLSSVPSSLRERAHNVYDIEEIE